MAGYGFDVRRPPFEDPDQPVQTDDPAGLVAGLALAKAKSLAATLTEEHVGIVLAADTLCVNPDGTLIGKPTSIVEARSMLATVSGSSQDVITGVAILPIDQSPVIFSDIATVRFGDLLPEAIDAYLDSGAWEGKAGGYNLFELMDSGWPVTVEGDPNTVVGLPLIKLEKVLADLGIEPDMV